VEVGPYKRVTALVPLVVLLLMAGCGSSQGQHPAPRTLGTVELKFRLLAQLGPLQYCDPDSYPVGRPVTPAYVSTRLAEIAAQDPQTYRDILGHFATSSPPTPPQELETYSAYKELAAIELTPDGDAYDFLFTAGPSSGHQATAIKGTIDRAGAIAVQSRSPYQRVCPICLAASTMIATPNGPIVVSALRPGMPVWTADRTGERLPATVLEAGSMLAPFGHDVVHLVLADGRQVWVSPGHPTADGRRVGDLAAGDRFDGSQIVSADRRPYAGRTYDLLPSGPTGFYWANGVLLASTLTP